MMTNELNNMELNNEELKQVDGGGFCIFVGYAHGWSICEFVGTNNTNDGYGGGELYNGVGGDYCNGIGFGLGATW